MNTPLAPARVLLAVATLSLAVGLASQSRRDRLPAPPVPDTKGEIGMRAPDLHFFAQRAWPLGRIPLDQWRRARIDAAEQRAENTLASGWDFRGPTNIGGRIADLAVDPLDPNRVFAACAEGGVLRTTDGGDTWTPVFDAQSTLAVGAVAIDPSQSNVIYAGTGEPNPGGGSVAYGGDGIYRSMDGGDTWTHLGLDGTGAIGRILVDTSNPQRIFVAAVGALWETGPDRGVYRSTDGGASWTRVLHTGVDAGAVDLVQRPDQPNVLFAAIWQRLRQPEAFDYGGPQCAVYRSTNSGDSWSIVGGGLPAPHDTLGRIGITLCASQPNTMYAVYAHRTGRFAGVFRSTNGGANWTRLPDPGSTSTFGWWFGNIRVDPNDPNRVFILELPLFRSTNAGASWARVDAGVHVDHHAMAFVPGPNPTVYEGNDGGIYRSDNDGATWQFAGGQPITQFYRLALDASNPSALYGGAQDNSTMRTLTGGLDDYDVIFGGDGFQPLIHPLTPSRIWAQFQYGSLSYSSDGGASWVTALTGIPGTDRKNWNSPIAQDPGNSEVRYFGTQRLWRSTSNTTWVAVSGDLTGGVHLGNQGQVNGTLTSIGVSPIDGNVLWTGSDDGLVQVSTNGGAIWTNVSAGLPGRWVTSVEPSPFSPGWAYVTVSGFRWAETLPRVYRTRDYGVTWTPIASNLPDAPANDVVADPETAGRLFVATDLGVHQSFDDGDSWTLPGTGMPSVVVTDMVLQTSTRTLVAGTYGRSIYSISVPVTAAVPGPTPAIAGRLLPPAPNPTRGGAWLSWELAAPAPVSLDIVSVNGRRVRSLTAASASAAGRTWWDARDQHGQRVPAGVYYIRAHAGERPLASGRVVVAP